MKSRSALRSAADSHVTMYPALAPTRGPSGVAAFATDGPTSAATMQPTNVAAPKRRANRALDVRSAPAPARRTPGDHPDHVDSAAFTLGTVSFGLIL